VESKDIISAAIQTFGERNQTVVAIEELSELQKELCKLLRGNCDNDEHIAEEVADVQIMLAQLVEMLDIKDMVQQYRQFKLRRLQSRIEAELEKQGVKRK
jgi:NTP pyrophosphatase (non-canonical NTP hydrolase)